jgi:hypothetical protein
MISLDSKLWGQLTGGYKTAFDPRPLLARLEAGRDVTTWPDLWNELHHQGDVGTASYAAVPHLVRIYRKLGAIDWNIYAIVATIELARDQRQNPEVPESLEKDYYRAIQELAEIGQYEVLRADETETVRAILGMIAISKGLRIHGKFLIEFSEGELLEINPLA